MRELKYSKLFDCMYYENTGKSIDLNKELKNIKSLDQIETENYKLLSKFRKWAVIEIKREEKLLDHWASIGFVRYFINENCKAIAKLNYFGKAHLDFLMYNIRH